MKYAALACALLACGGAGDDSMMMGDPDGGMTSGDGSMTTVPWDNLEGLVSLPSFHTAGAAIVTWAFRQHPWRNLETNH